LNHVAFQTDVAKSTDKLVPLVFTLYIKSQIKYAYDNDVWPMGLTTQITTIIKLHNNRVECIW